MILYIFLIIAFITLGIFIANNAQSEFIAKYKKYFNYEIMSTSGVEDFIKLLQNYKPFNNVNVFYTNEELEDCYNNQKKAVILSNKTLYNTNIASLAITAHEFGHCEQDLTNNKTYKIAQNFRTVSKICGKVSIPLFIIGLLLFILLDSYNFIGLIVIGLGALLFLTIIVSSILTTYIEFDATKRGLNLLKKYEILNKEEIKMAKDFLKSAGYTYLGNFFSIILSWTFLVPKYKLI